VKIESDNEMHIVTLYNCIPIYRHYTVTLYIYVATTARFYSMTAASEFFCNCIFLTFLSDYKYT